MWRPCAPRLPVLANPLARPSEIVLALDDVGPVALALAPLLLPGRGGPGHLAQYRTMWQAVRPELDGTDLRRLGVPAAPSTGKSSANSAPAASTGRSTLGKKKRRW